MKTLKPKKGGGFACMHVKSIIFDDKVLLTGSVNMTHNGYENNKEHLLRLTEPSLLADVVADFEATWLEAEEVTAGEIKLMMENHQARCEKKEAEAESRRSARSVSRSLTRELSEARDDGATQDAGSVSGP